MAGMCMCVSRRSGRIDAITFTVQHQSKRLKRRRIKAVNGRFRLILILLLHSLSDLFNVSCEQIPPRFSRFLPPPLAGRLDSKCKLLNKPRNVVVVCFTAA